MKIKLAKKEIIHFIGIGGIGMSLNFDNERSRF